MCCVHPWRKTCLQTLQTRWRPAREREWPVQILHTSGLRVVLSYS